MTIKLDQYSELFIEHQGIEYLAVQKLQTNESSFKTIYKVSNGFIVKNQKETVWYDSLNHIIAAYIKHYNDVVSEMINLQ